MKPLNVFVGCERSQEVAKAFREKGHNAFSLDTEDCYGGHPEWHIKSDVIEYISEPPYKWDLMILHPPCTCIAVSGNSTYAKGMDKYKERIKAVEWTQLLWNYATSQCSAVCMENPVGVLNTLGNFPKPQYIQPYQFGHMEQKKTGLWLYGLNKLNDTDNVYDAMMKLPKNERERLHYLPPSSDRATLRSKTFTGIAKAMAEQWG